jgi:hypothetical protein
MGIMGGNGKAGEAASNFLTVRLFKNKASLPKRIFHTPSLRTLQIKVHGATTQTSKEKRLTPITTKDAKSTKSEPRRTSTSTFLGGYPRAVTL